MEKVNSENRWNVSSVILCFLRQFTKHETITLTWRDRRDTFYSFNWLYNAKPW